jgi:hypothetical protein
MYRRAVLVCLVALLPAYAVSAQGWDARIREHRARVDSLELLYQQARQRAEESERRERESRLDRRPVIDTAFVGPMVILAQPSVVRRSTERFSEAWQHYEPLLGSSAARLRGVVFLVSGDRPSVTLQSMRTRANHWEVALLSTLRREAEREIALRAVGAPIHKLMPTEVQRWLGEIPLGATQDPSRVYRELAMSTVASGQRCYRGELSACSALLALTDDTLWVRHYTPDQLRQLLKTTYHSPRVYQCVQQRQDSTCIGIFSSPRGNTALMPLSPGARATLLHQAIRMGGAGALDRLLSDSTASVSGALANVARSDIDSVVSAWHDTIMESRPTASAGLGLSVIVTLMWVLIFTALALRSTRWRLG